MTGAVLAAAARSARRFPLSDRAAALAGSGGAAARVWEEVRKASAQPGVINMGQGFPDFPGSPVARSVAAEAVAAGEASLNQYSPQQGLLALRQSVCQFYERRYGRPGWDAASEVVITAGAQEALAAAFSAFINPGDEVVLFEPMYPFMLGALRLAGGIPRVVTLQHEDGFAIDMAALRRAASSPRARMLVLNSPHNPTGHVVSQLELEAVASVCCENDLIAVSDEVYEHAVFPGAGRRHRRLTDVEGMRDRTITLGSGGKLFALTGWRVAWATGPEHLIEPLGASHTHFTYSAPTPLQAGVAAALEAEDGLAEVGTLFGGNFELLSAALMEGTTATSVCPASGGYFLVASVPGADMDWCRSLAEEKGVAATPVSVFYASDVDEVFRGGPCSLVRFTVCKSRAYIERVCAALTT